MLVRMPWTDVPLLVAAVTLLTWLVLGVLVMFGNRRLRRLALLDHLPEQQAPRHARRRGDAGHHGRDAL